jgi:RNA polymerase sigma factor (sigma-70 family)
MEKPTPDILLERCKSNDTLAFKELYGHFARSLFNASMRILNNRNEAEDVLQESFIKAFKDIERFEALAPFGAWLRKVVINSSLDVLRKQKIKFIEIESLELADMAEEPEEADYDIATVVQCMKQLPDGYRVIVTLYLVEGLTHLEIAESLNISLGTSKSQYNRGRKKLSELIKKKNTAHA